MKRELHICVGVPSSILGGIMELKKINKLKITMTLVYTLLYFLIGCLIYSIILLIMPKLDKIIILSLINIIVGTIGVFLFKRYKIYLVWNIKRILKGIFLYGFFFVAIELIVTLDAFRYIYLQSNKAQVIRFNQSLLYWIPYTLTTGFCEEIVFRFGFINYLIDSTKSISKKRAFIVCVYSSILFGFMHLFGILTANDNIRYLVIQSSLGALIGYCFAVIYLKTKNIIPSILLHAFWDFSTMCNSYIRYSSNFNILLYQVICILISASVATYILIKDRGVNTIQQGIFSDLKNDI